MTRPELTGPSLSTDQWRQISELATSLTPEQAIWISGYFAGLGHQLRTSTIGIGNLPLANIPPTTRPQAASSRQLTVLFATETGNSSGLATSLVDAAQALGINVRRSDIADYKPRNLADEQDLLVITSTHGEGDPPQTALTFFEFVESRRAPKLPNLRFAVLALGDSSYERFCEAGKRLDRRFEELGGQRLADRIDCDVDFEEPAAAWIQEVLGKLRPTAQVQAPAFEAKGQIASGDGRPVTFDKKHPFPAPVLDNIVLTGRGSTKETRHIELSLADSGLVYRPGDALGVHARNEPALVAALIERLAVSGDAVVNVKKASITLTDALERVFEITTATPRFLDHWADITNASELLELRKPENSEARTAFLRGHHILDIIERFPAPGISADTLLAGLRPLQPRLYSIASSLSAMPEEAHLTVSTVRYELFDRPRTGVASGYLAMQTAEGAQVPVYIQSNDHFHLPDDDVSILMIGAGTGVAPYRAFMQEREARGATGEAWLVFGERNFRSDFLYQVEWQALLKNKVLTRMDVAFSRDSSPKTYVQDRLRLHGRDVYAWLEEGAHLYVCGDAAHMAPDVHAALIEVLEQHGGLDRDAASEYLAAMTSDRRYRRDVY